MVQSTCSTPRLSPLNSKPILLGFDGADMSSDAGLTLLREIERKAGLAQRLAGFLIQQYPAVPVLFKVFAHLC